MQAFWHPTFQFCQFCENRSVSAMNPFPLQCILLIAVAISQIFGGISCCCLRNVIFASIGESSFSKSGVQSKDSTAFDGPNSKVACSKCASRESRKSLVTAGRENYPCLYRPQIGEDNQCRCVKPTINPSNSTEPPSFHPNVQLAVAHDPVVNTQRDIVKLLNRNYAVPIRFGGHCWQSIACVWKN